MLSGATQELFEAIDELNLQKFEKAIKDGADVNSFVGGDTPLISIISAWAIDGNSEDAYKSMTDLLIKNQNININIQNREQRNTALHMAISFKLAEVVKLLLAHQSIDFSIRNYYQVDHYPYPPNRYNDTALEYAKKLGTPEIVRKIEEEIYRRTTLSDRAKLPLKKAKPYIVKVLIVSVFSALFVIATLNHGILSGLLRLLFASYLVLPMFLQYLILESIYTDITNIHSYRNALLIGLTCLYYGALFADIASGKRYVQLLFSVVTPLILSEEGCSAFLNKIDTLTTLGKNFALACCLACLFFCLALICIARLSAPDNPPDAQQPEPLSHLERMLIMRAINEPLNEVR